MDDRTRLDPTVEGRPGNLPEVKICGLKSAAIVELVLSRGGREVGFVHFPKSPRHLPLAEIAELRKIVGERARVAIVTVDPDDALVEAIAGQVRPDTIQLHGAEAPERVAEIAARSGLATMKAISVSGADDLAAMERYRGIADRILLDAKAPKGSAIPGGNGVAFDWALLEALRPEARFVLSGGINPGNVAEAIARVRPLGVDVSSGVESAPGVKDAARIAALFDALQAASRNPQRQAS